MLECIVGNFKTITPETIAGILSVMPYNASVRANAKPGAMQEHEACSRETQSTCEGNGEEAQGKESRYLSVYGCRRSLVRGNDE